MNAERQRRHLEKMREAGFTRKCIQVPAAGAEDYERWRKRLLNKWKKEGLI